MKICICWSTFFVFQRYLFFKILNDYYFLEFQMGVVVGYVIFFYFKFLRLLLNVENLCKPFSPMSLLVTK
jgi:hypothetical protein